MVMSLEEGLAIISDLSTTCTLCYILAFNRGGPRRLVRDSETSLLVTLTRGCPQNNTSDATIILLYSEPRRIGDAHPDRNTPRFSRQTRIHVLASIT